MPDKKKILLLGGTGAMGIYLAPELLQLGYQVYITSRRQHTSENPDMVFLTGNAKDPTFLGPILDLRFDAIVDFMIYHTDEFSQRHEELLNSTSHYLFVSSYRVYGDNHGNPITEDSPRLLDSVQDPEYLKTDEYGLTKARQENILRTSGKKNWTIIRPAITYSKERFQLGTMEAADFLKRALNGKTVIFPRQMLSKHATMSWAGDVAKLISRLIFNDAAMCEAFTVSTSEHHTWREIMNYYSELVNMRVKIVDLSEYQKIMGGPYQIKYDRMLDRIVDNSKVLAVTGMKQSDFISLKSGLKMELESFMRAPAYRGYNANRDRMMDEIISSKSNTLLSKCKRKFQTIAHLYREKKLLLTIRARILLLPGFRQLKKVYLKMKSSK